MKKGLHGCLEEAVISPEEIHYRMETRDFIHWGTVE